MIVLNGRRGLHDVITKTKVILMDFKGNEINLDKKLFITRNTVKKEENVEEVEKVEDKPKKKKQKH